MVRPLLDPARRPDGCARRSGGRSAAIAAERPTILPSVRWRRASVLGLTLVVLVGLVSVPRALYGLETAAAFDGFTANERHRWTDTPARVASLRAATAALTEPGEAIYVWAPVAAFHVAVDRPAATRFDRRNWQTGEVYGSDVIAELPGVWDDLMDDLDESRPRLVIERLDEPIPDDSPLAALLASHYRPVFTSNRTMHGCIVARRRSTMLHHRRAAAERTTGRSEARCLPLPSTRVQSRGRARRTRTGDDRRDSHRRVATSTTRDGAVDRGVDVDSPRGAGDLEIRIGTTWILSGRRIGWWRRPPRHGPSTRSPRPRVPPTSVSDSGRAVIGLRSAHRGPECRRIGVRGAQVRA